MAKRRVQIPDDIATEVQFRSDRTCCVCREKGKSIQIHHIDEDPSNYDEDNLAVLCFECHNSTQTGGGFGRKLDGHQILKYREDWYARVQKRRNMADIIASAISAGAESKLEELIHLYFSQQERLGPES